MDDNHKIGLIFALTGLAAGIISGFLDLHNFVIVIVAFAIFYASTYIVKIIGVDVIKYGKPSSILKSGAFSFLGTWLLSWIIIYNILHY